MARPNKRRCICSKPVCTGFAPDGITQEPAILLGYDEYETIRLIDYRGLTQQECAQRMQVSRTTITRIYDEARKKIAEALVCGRRIEIRGGDVIVCAAMRPACADEKNCCHRAAEEKEKAI